MTEHFDLLIKGGTIVNHAGVNIGDVASRGGRTVAIGDLSSATADRVIDATGLHILPGVIDTQVHFREPGNEHKEDLKSGSLSAVMGGVTAVFEMPNTSPLTTTAKSLQDKVDRASNRMHCDFAFYMGATGDNAHEMASLERVPGCCGVKIFMGASTGDLLVPDDETLRKVLAHGSRRVAIHAEDEPRMNERLPYREGSVHQHPVWRDEETAFIATKRIVAIARETRRRIHVLHVTTAREMAFLGQNKDIASVEATPQHLTLSAPDCYDQHGTFAQMNPPIRDEENRLGVWSGVTDGTVDVIGSDHAPHTREEKAQPYPDSPSGMPGVQTLLPLLLNNVAEGRLSLMRLVDLTSHGANRLFGLRDKGRLAMGMHADYTLVDLKESWTVSDTWLKSKCGWSPFEGMDLTGKPKATILRGTPVMLDDELVAPSTGEAMRFQETL